MTVTNVARDPETLTLTITSEYAAEPSRVWQLWADPRKLERWWGPPTYPATVTEHRLVAGGRVTYFMTGPTGDRHFGYWNVLAAEPPAALEFEDGFADDSGAPNSALPSTRTRVRINAAGAVTRMTMVATFPSVEAMTQLIEMGMEEGIRLALGQADAILAEVAA